MGLLVSAFLRFYQIIGSKQEDNQQSSEVVAGTSKSPKKGRKRGNTRKQNEDPKFSTNLSSPIEDILEDTITEDIVDTATVSKKKGKAHSKQLKKVEIEEDPPVDPIGYSFLPVKEKGKKYRTLQEAPEKIRAAVVQTKKTKYDGPTDKETTGVKSEKYKKPTCSTKVKQTKQHLEEFDEVQNKKLQKEGLPVGNSEQLDLSSKIQAATLYSEKNSTDTLNSVVDQVLRKPKVDASKPSIIDHYQRISKKQAVIEPPAEVRRRFSASLEKVQIFALENKVQETNSPKESKKVTSEISYANVVSNSIPGSGEVEDIGQVSKQICEGSQETTSVEDRQNFQKGEIRGTQQESRTSSVPKISEVEKYLQVATKPLEECNKYLQSKSPDISNTELETNDNSNDTCSSSSFENIGYSLASEAISSAENSISFVAEGEESDKRIPDLVQSLCYSYKTVLKTNGEESAEKILEEEACARSTAYNVGNTKCIEILNKLEIERSSVNSEGDIEVIGNADLDTSITHNFSKDSCLKSDLIRSRYDSVVAEDSSVTLNTQRSLEDEVVHAKGISTCITDKSVEKLSESQTMPQQVRVLTLNDKEHQECTLYRLEKQWAIQFRVGPSLFGRKVYLYCNYPLQAANFDRCTYHLLQWKWDEGTHDADDTAAYAQIQLDVSGSFHYYFTYEKGENAVRQGSGYFLVDPLLKYGDNEPLLLDCIQCQTVLAKGLGSFSTWENKLKVAKESGYNMIHFTPIQELGESNSSYSLKDQLKLNPIFANKDGDMPTFDEVEKFVSKLRTDWKMTSVCDIVLNHTANESEWLLEHPEATYNCQNCLYMRPAYLLDAAFHTFSMDVKKGLYENRGVPAEVETEDHLNAIKYHFKVSVLDPLNIPELFICDVNKYVAEFLNKARVSTPGPMRYADVPLTEELKLMQDAEYRRLTSKIDFDLALKLYNVYWNDTFDEESRLKKCAEMFKNKLDSLNNAKIEEVNNDLNVAIENVIAGIRYFRVQADGPKFKEITVNTPLVYRYFTDYGDPVTLQQHENIMYSDNGRFLMAHNGWVMNSDPLRNFADPESKVYIRRELIAWGDSVKLRYGSRPSDSPYLWSRMRRYVEQTAMIFDGIRLDNCHSTPIPVAEYLLDCARRIRPDLYVVAELFTNSDMTDNIFVNRLGITSLIREAMSAWDSHEEGRLVYRYGGCPVGSFYQPPLRPLVPCVAHALFLDLTHDNPCPIEKRSVFDLLPSAALVNMACCASGSNRGYDELVPHHIHVVDETREYAEWTYDEKPGERSSRYVNTTSGIISAKRAINDLHFLLGNKGFNQVYVDQIDPDIVAITRHCPITHQSYILVAFTAFGHPGEDADKYQRNIRPLRFEGVLEEIILEATLSHIKSSSGGPKYAKFKEFVKDAKWINGLSEYTVTVKKNISVAESEFIEKVDSHTPNVTQLNFKNFKPGSIIVVKASLPETMRKAVKTVRELMPKFSITKESDLTKIISKMSLADLNRALYRCDQEERDEGFGFDTYSIPNFGSMVYAGLQGFMSLIANIRPNNDLGHPMCANLRDGNWMIDYISNRLKLDIGTKDLGEWIANNTQCFKEFPRYLIPCYFDVVLTGLYVLLLEQCHRLMSDFVNNGSTFVKGLSLGSVQMAAYIQSTKLPDLSPNLAPPKPPIRKQKDGTEVQACVTLAAGLPHFSVGCWRNWGRDTFIALRGLCILTGRHQEAREHILGYAACLRHGLLPNLLDGGQNPRYNCRDALWWWLNCIRDYCIEVPSGISILQDIVSRIFPTDDSPNEPPGKHEQPLYDVIQEALNKHFQGLTFRERNAGPKIDECMTDAGFNVQIGVHPEMGFIFGGNRWNCGTWMDKMGSSFKAGNRGIPATPRDGSAVELIGLSKTTISWLAEEHKKGRYPYEGVERSNKDGTKVKWTYEQWASKIQDSFEKYFWVHTKPVDGELRPDLINKRGIYKDSHGSSHEYTDFQLRCNFPISMVVAPELFNPEHAWAALKQAETFLLGPLGMKTLDPEDWAYKGDYDNSCDSTDASVANGFNYHQGPEWVWPVGYFLRAKLIFASKNGALKETLASTKLILSKHFVELQTSDWRGLPELTNSNGSYCKDSSKTQAWSMSCILEVLHDLQRIESTQNN